MTEGPSVPERSRVPSGRRNSRSSADQSPIAVSATVLKRARDLADQAAFLWSSRSVVARSSAVTFATLAQLDQRITRFIAALSERPGLAEPLLTTDDTPFKSGHAFVTAAVALRTGALSVFDSLVERVESDGELQSPLVSALAWFDYDDVSGYIGQLLGSSVPAVLRLGLAAATAHRFDPGAPLEHATAAPDPRLRATALEAAGRLGAGDLRPRLRAALEDEDDACRFWAAWSTVRLGDRAGIPALGRFATGGGPLATAACDMAFRALDPYEAIRTQARLQSSPSNGRLAVLAAGAIGDPALANWLLGRMTSASVARAAGAAFCLITGLDLRRDDLDGEGPPRPPSSEGLASGALESDAESGDANPGEPAGAGADEVDDHLVWPDTIRLREWWELNRQTFVPGTRYLAGMPIRPAELATVLRTGNQHQRAAAALELAIHDPDTSLLDVAAPAHQQK